MLEVPFNTYFLIVYNKYHKASYKPHTADRILALEEGEKEWTFIPKDAAL